MPFIEPNWTYDDPPQAPTAPFDPTAPVVWPWQVDEGPPYENDAPWPVTPEWAPEERGPSPWDVELPMPTSEDLLAPHDLAPTPDWLRAFDHIL